MTRLMWPEYDNSGFTSTQESLIQYGEAVFCEFPLFYAQASSNQSTLAPEERRRRLGLDDEPNAMDPMQLMDGPYQPSNEPDPDTFTLTDNRGSYAENGVHWADGWGLDAGHAVLEQCPNVFDPEVQAGLPPFNTSPLAASHALSPPRAHVTPMTPVAAASHALSPPQAHDTSSGSLPCVFATSGSCNAHDASSGSLPCAFATSGSSRYANKPTSTDWGGCHCHCRSPTCRYPIRLYDANSAALLRALWSDSLRRHYNATAIALINPFPWGRIHGNHNVTIITSQWIPPSPPLPDSSLVQPTQNDKENLTPPGTGEKHPLDQEPEDSSKRTRRQSKLPSHLEDAGYVAPSKGKRKSTVKPAAKPMPTKRASKKK
ncbi:hypothetical protein IMY05_C4347001000 [Salix suchowensis]|nr:hypothetical protein IMY05_C4347001000 [Salix suchowensis]